MYTQQELVENWETKAISQKKRRTKELKKVIEIQAALSTRVLAAAVTYIFNDLYKEYKFMM